MRIFEISCANDIALRMRIIGSYNYNRKNYYSDEQRVSENSNNIINIMNYSTGCNRCLSNETSCFTRSGSKADLSRVSVRGFAIVRFRSLGRRRGRPRDSLSMVQRRPYRAFYRLSISTWSICLASTPFLTPVKSMQHAIHRAARGINPTLINTVVMNIPQSARTPATISGFDAGLRTTFRVVLVYRNKKVEAVRTAATSDPVFRSVKIKRPH